VDSADDQDDEDSNKESGCHGTPRSSNTPQSNASKRTSNTPLSNPPKRINSTTSTGRSPTKRTHIRAVSQSLDENMTQHNQLMSRKLMDKDDDRSFIKQVVCMRDQKFNQALAILKEMGITPANEPQLYRAFLLIVENDALSLSTGASTWRLQHHQESSLRPL
jgi:hypothetical protein